MKRNVQKADFGFVKRYQNYSLFDLKKTQNALKGKTIEQAKGIIETFINMIKREITDEKELEKLEDAIAFKNVSNMPARVKCALLAWHTIEDMLDKK